MRIVALITIVFSLFVSDILAQNQKPGIPYRKGDLWGVANKFTREILVEPIYDSVYIDQKNRILLAELNGKLGAIHFDFDKKEYCDIIDPQYDVVEYTVKGLITAIHNSDNVEKNDRISQYNIYDNPLSVGFCSFNGDQILKNEYKFIQYKREYLLLFKNSVNAQCLP